MHCLCRSVSPRGVVCRCKRLPRGSRARRLQCVSWSTVIASLPKSWRDCPMGPGTAVVSARGGQLRSRTPLSFRYPRIQTCVLFSAGLAHVLGRARSQSPKHHIRFSPLRIKRLVQKKSRTKHNPNMVVLKQFSRYCSARTRNPFQVCLALSPTSAVRSVRSSITPMKGTRLLPRA